MDQRAQQAPSRRVIRLVLNILAGISAALMFGAPTYLAMHPHPGNSSATVVLVLAYLGTTGFVGMWLYANELALLAAMNLYGVQTQPFRFSIAGRLFPGSFLRLSKRSTLLLAGVAYMVTIYAFALSYKFISNVNPASFEKPIKDVLGAVYFSIVTIATVGYGDIAPVTPAARVLVSAEILIGVAYSIFFFSIIAGFIRELSPPEEKPL
jgi:voltage-gated potassium channel Kch